MISWRTFPRTVSGKYEDFQNLGVSGKYEDFQNLGEPSPELYQENMKIFRIFSLNNFILYHKIPEILVSGEPDISSLHSFN